MVKRKGFEPPGEGPCRKWGFPNFNFVANKLDSWTLIPYFRFTSHWCWDSLSVLWCCLRGVISMRNHFIASKWRVSTVKTLQKRLALAEQRCTKHIIAHHPVFSQRHLHVLTYTHVTCAYEYRYYRYIIHTGFLCRKKQLKWKLSEEEVEVDEAMVFHGSDPWLGFRLIISTPKGRFNGEKHSLAKENLLEDPEPRDLAFQQ